MITAKEAKEIADKKKKQLEEKTRTQLSINIQKNIIEIENNIRKSAEEGYNETIIDFFYNESLKHFKDLGFTIQQSVDTDDYYNTPARYTTMITWN